MRVRSRAPTEGPHSSLRLEVFSRLPLHLRKITKDAADIHGDIENLWDIYDRASNDPIVEFLPAFYGSLDTSPIPELIARLGSSSSSSADYQFFDDKVSRACLALQSILALDTKAMVPTPAAPDLWPRIWPWVEFIDTYRDPLPKIQMLENQVVYYNAVLNIILLLRRHEATAAVIDATPGIRVILVRIWALYVQDPEIAGKNKFGNLCGYIHSSLKLHEDPNFAEAIEGAGGSRAELATIVLKHIKHVVAFPSANNTIFCLRPVVALLRHKCRADTLFDQTLIDQGVVEILTSVVCLLTGPAFVNDMDLFDTCFATIFRYVMTPFGHNLVTQALRAGILPAFLERARRPCTPQMQHVLDSTLTIFVASVVYLSVLSQMHASITALPFAVNHNSFKGFGLSTRWKTFWTVLQQRFGLMRTYLARQTVSKACDNVACGVILPREQFKRCAECLTTIYCSPSCQAIDWRHDHRDSCQSILRMRLGEPEGVTSRDRSFLRALIHADYLEMKRTILIQEVHHLRAHVPGTSAPAVLPFVVFDYSRPKVACAVEVGALPTLAANAWAHVNGTGRQIRAHAMQVTDGGSTHQWVFPLRAAGPEVGLAVEQLAGSRMVVGAEMAARIQAIMSLDVVEIH
ncbi:hypothetical protein C8R46DRAFT_1344292 [Mycena filopes]|nr:hypothetical protein C8R46DRAFT_1344292 [Mycena filopes]